MQFNAILCLCCNSMQFCNYNCNFSKKKMFWTNILSNLMQFCVKVAIKCHFLKERLLSEFFKMQFCG